MDDCDLPEWEPAVEFHPLFRMWAALPMDYGDFWERQRDAEGLPEVWR